METGDASSGGSAGRMAKRVSQACVIVFAVCCAALLASGIARLFLGMQSEDHVSTVIALFSPMIIMAAVEICIWRSVGRVR